MKRLLILLTALVLLTTGACAASEPTVFGTTERGRDMVYYRLGDPAASKVLLMTFGVHAFEDAFPMDGRVLRDIAYRLIAHFDQDASALGDYALYIVPAVNVDGMEEGVSHNGFGRTNAAGIDINRDFPTNWKRIYEIRSRTGAQPLASVEAQAVAALCQELQPDISIDVHGWRRCCYGDAEISLIFHELLQTKICKTNKSGMFFEWLESEFERAAMLELPDFPRYQSERYAQETTPIVVEGIRRICNP